MRILCPALAAATLALAVVPRPVSACSWDPCYYDSSRIETIELRTASPVPLDGAFVIDTNEEESPTCLSELAQHLSIAVTRDGVPVPGAVVQLRGLLEYLVWRPDALLAPNTAYVVQVVVDNDALGPDGGWTSGEPCGDAQELASFDLVTGETLASAPLPATPTLAASDLVWRESLHGVACCPGPAPLFSDGGCYPEVYWDGDHCGFVHGFTGLAIQAEVPALPAAMDGQFVHQLTFDGEPIARTLDGGPLGALRRTAACVRLERIQLGTGELVASAESCPSPDLAASLGPVALDPMLTCDDPLMCAVDYEQWSTSCTPHDPDTLPAPEFWPYETRLEGCPDDGVPVDSGPVDPAPTSSADDTGSATDSSSDGDPGADNNGACACTSARSAPLLALLPLLARRRRAASRPRLQRP